LDTGDWALEKSNHAGRGFNIHNGSPRGGRLPAGGQQRAEIVPVGQFERQPCPYLVNAQHRLDMDAILDYGHHLVVETDVLRRPGRDDGDAREHPLDVAHQRSDFHAERLGS
jgi:hypothetical protein